MQDNTNIIDCYDKTANNYADKFIDELDKKHLDRMLLKSFAAENNNSGKMIDLGCGPGHTTKYLSGCGVTDLIGIDISEAMVSVAGSLNPGLTFETADMLNLRYPDNTFGSAVAFYSIVHFNEEQLKITFREISRVLCGNGQFLLSFHVGSKVVHFDNFLGKEVNIDFYFFGIPKIVALVTESGFSMIDIIERQPYLDVEYQGRRAYIWAKKNVTGEIPFAAAIPGE